MSTAKLDEKGRIVLPADLIAGLNEPRRRVCHSEAMSDFDTSEEEGPKNQYLKAL